MATTNFKGNPVGLSGELPAVGSSAPGFSLVTSSLEEVSLDKYTGKKKILNIVPSLDTGICAKSTHEFNNRIKGNDGVVVLVVSQDLPFAQKRFCSAEGIENVVTLSGFRSPFITDYGVEMTDGPLKGLTARSIVALDEDNKVVYTELVPEITQEPDYDKALAAVGA